MIRLFFAILNMSIASSLLLLLVLAGRWVLRPYGAAGFRRLLWVPLLFRLLVPYSLPSALSIYNLLHRRLERPGGALLSLDYLDTAGVAQSLAGGQPLAEKQVQAALCGLWLLGMAALLCSFFVQYLGLRRALKGAYELSGQESEACRRQVGLRRPVPVLCTKKVKGPLVFGFFCPCILLPENLKEAPDKKCILLHEMTHVRCGDHLLLLAGNLALLLHWFNPLVWLARVLLARDIEQACDVRVLRVLQKGEQITYAQTLVDWAGRRLMPVAYEAFGEQDLVRRVEGILEWKRLPRWAEVLLGCAVTLVFLCTATNPVLKSDVYLPVSSPFVSQSRQEAFRQAAGQLARALETGDVQALSELASLDADYFRPLYQPLAELSLTVQKIHVYCNSSTSAEVYLEVDVENGAGLYQAGAGTLVAHLTQTEYREAPLADCLMPQKKYEGIRLADSGSEASRLAVRLFANLDQDQFSAQSISPVTVARVCMESAIEDKGESPPFSARRMGELAKEYFALEGFSCHDPLVYDATREIYFYEPWPRPRLYVTDTDIGREGQMRVEVESYEDPLCLYPVQKLECNLERIASP